MEFPLLAISSVSENTYDKVTTNLKFFTFA